MRKKRALLLLSGLILLLTLAAALWLGIRWRHYKFLAESDFVDRWSHADKAWFWRCPERVYLMDLNETAVSGEATGAALQHYASVRHVTFRRNSKAWLDACLSRWQDRRSLHELLVVYSTMDDAHLAGFAGADLQTGWFKDNRITGENFPYSPHLTTMEIISNPLSDAGLRHLAQQCPGLKKLWLHDIAITPAGVRDSGLFQLPMLTNLYIREMEATEEDLKALRKAAAEANAGLHIYLEDEL